MSLENTRQLPKEIQARQLPFQEIICTETQYIRQIGLLIAVSKNNYGSQQRVSRRGAFPLVGPGEEKIMKKKT